MRRTLLATTAILVVSAPASAETVIGAKRTTSASTSTINNGSPDSIRISSAGSIEINAGTAVTIDTNNAVTVEGKIIVSNAAGGAGIVANAGTNGDIIVASGATITVDEAYTATDIDNDGDLDGPFAVGANRFGIRTLGAHTGKLTQSGTIMIEGNDSAGIWLGGPLSGAFTHDGKTTVLGDRAVGVRADQINGNVRLAGQVSVVGLDAVGARFVGDVTGAMVVQGNISSTGYRFITPPADPTKLDADDLLQGGSALMIEGNITGGILLAVPPKDNSSTNNDEDGDGIEDSKEGSANVVTYGAAPAMVIGATGNAVTIGPIAGSGTGFGLQIDGIIAGNGVYSGVAGNGLQIGGRGGAVTIAGGMGVAGTISATAKDANATALRVGSGAIVPEVRVSGTISASGGSTAASTSTAVLIGTGANVSTIRNSGTIKAIAGGTAATAIAVQDRSGGVSLVENSGAISGTGAASGSNRNVAIDLSANTTGTTIRQTAVASGVAAPSITGDVLTGTGNDLFDVADGTVAGTVTLGQGNDRLQLSGDATLSGKVLFGAGDDQISLAGTAVFTAAADFAGGGFDTLNLSGTSRFAGSMLNAGQLGVTVSGGTLDIAVPVTIGSLSMASGGVLVATLDKDAGQGTAITVNGTASFASGSVLQIKLADFTNAEGRYTVISAGTLQGASGITTRTDLIPFLYKASLAGNAPANQLAVDIARKSTIELGLNTSQAGAWNAVYSALATDTDIGGVFLNITGGDLFRQTLDQILPEHAGGTFRALSQGSRTMGRQAMDPVGPIKLSEQFRVAFGAGVWGTSKPSGTTQPFNNDGLGFSATAELETGAGNFGADFAWMWNETKTGGLINTVFSNTYLLGAHWHGKWGGLSAFAQGNYGMVNFDSKRFFVGQAPTKKVERTTAGKWDGKLTTFTAGVSLEGGGRYFFFRPTAQIDYVRVSEDAHTETGGGAGLNLSIEKRNSSELAAEGGLTVGIDFTGMAQRETNWFRVEVESGWREILDGKIGSTTAHFGTAASFSLVPEQGTSSWYGRLRAIGGSADFQLGGEFGAEDNNGRVGLSLRGTLRMPF